MPVAKIPGDTGKPFRKRIRKTGKYTGRKGLRPGKTGPFQHGANKSFLRRTSLGGGGG